MTVKRFLALVLVLTMVFTLAVPSYAFAEDTDNDELTIEDGEVKAPSATQSGDNQTEDVINLKGSALDYITFVYPDGYNASLLNMTGSQIATISYSYTDNEGMVSKTYTNKTVGTDQTVLDHILASKAQTSFTLAQFVDAWKNDDPVTVTITDVSTVAPTLASIKLTTGTTSSSEDVASVDISDTSPQTLKIYAWTVMSNGTVEALPYNDATWNIDTSVATVAGGTGTTVNRATLTPVSTGTTTLTVTYSGVSKNLTVNSTMAPVAASVVITGTTSVAVGDAVHLGLQFKDANDQIIEPADPTGRWTSSDSTVIEGLGVNVLNSSFTKTALKAGTARITYVNGENEALTAYVDVTVTAYVAQIGDAKYETLADAIAAVPADGTQTTITMIANSAVDAGLTIPANKNVVLELNGHVLSGILGQSGTTALITNKGTLVIQDSTDTNANGGGTGRITNNATNPDTGASPGYASNTITNTGTLIINSGYIESTTNSYAAYAVDNQTNGTSQTPVLTINGGKLFSQYTDAIRMFLNSTTNLNKVVINGGVIDSDKASGRVIVIHDPNAKVNKGELDITGGEIQGTVNAWSAANAGGVEDQFSDEQYAELKISITGGKIETLDFSSMANTELRAQSLSVTGGTFATDPSAYVSEGFEAASGITGTDGTYAYGIKKAPVAQIGDVEYESLAAAFAAITNSTATTIEVLADSTGAGIVVPSGRNITVNFNNHSYTVVEGPGAGSAGTQNQVFQLLKNSTIVFNNGVIAVGEENATLNTYYRVIQNYSNLTLNNMEIKGDNLKTYNGYVNSVIESDNGAVALTGTTKILDVTGGTNLIKAINVDACGSYPSGTQVTIDLAEGGEIGTIHCYTEYGGTTGDTTLTITAGTVGGLTVDEGSTVEVTKASTATVAAPAGYKWSEAVNGEQTLTAIEYVAEIVGGAQYETLVQAYTNASDGDTIKLLGNESLENFIEVRKDLTFDLNGHNITSTTSGVFDIYSEVTIQDTSSGTPGEISGAKWTLWLNEDNDVLNVTSGTISETKADGYSAIMLRAGTAYISGNAVITASGTTTGSAGIENSGDLTISGNAQVSGYYGITIWGDGTTGSATLTMNGGTVTGNNDFAITGNGSAGYGGTVININSGTVTAENAPAIYHPQIGVLNIGVENHPANHACPTITGTSGIEMRSGELNVYCGTITATGDFTIEANGNGSTSTGVAVAVSQHSTNNTIAVNIEGGTLNATGSGSYGIYEEDVQNPSSGSNISVNVSGGSVSGTAGAVEIKDVDTPKDGVTISAAISGGSFSSQVEADYCADGFIPKANNNGTYGVEEGWKISFNANGGSGEMDDATVAKGSSYSAPECTFMAPEDKEFSGWSDGSTTYQVGDPITVNSDIILTAQWTEIVAETVSVTFNANGGEGSMGEQTITKNTQTALTKNAFTKSGSKFDGWNTVQTPTTQNPGTKYVDEQQVTLTADLVLYAQWKDDSFTPQEFIGSYGTANWISKQYLNIQDQIYYTVQFHVNETNSSTTDTYVGNNWYIEYTFGNGEATKVYANEFNALNETTMKQTLAAGGVYPSSTSSSGYYEIRHSVYPVQMSSVVKIELFDESGHKFPLYTYVSGDGSSRVFHTMNEDGNYQGTTYSYLETLLVKADWSRTAGALIAYGQACDAQKWN